MTLQNEKMILLIKLFAYSNQGILLIIHETKHTLNSSGIQTKFFSFMSMITVIYTGQSSEWLSADHYGNPCHRKVFTIFIPFMPRELSYHNSLD